MATPPILAGASFFDKYLLIATRPSDQGVAATEIAANLPVDPSLFTVTVDGRQVPVIGVDTNAQALLTLAESIRSNAKVTVTYADPDGDQEAGVLQDDEGEDAVSATLTAEYTAGYRSRLLEGAELGAKYGVDDYEWYYGSQDGFYVSDAEGHGGQPDTPIQVTAVAGDTFTIQLKPVIFFDNPSYRESATEGFRSYRYTNELTTLTLLRQGRDIKVGDSFTLLDLVDPARSEKFVSGKSSVMATNDPDNPEPQRVFDIMSFETIASSATFWLSLGAWLYESKGVDFSVSVVGSTHDDEIITRSGNDNLSGGAGDDLLQSGGGNDTVAAGDGDDLIIGGDGAGNDRYDGGNGTDTVKYTSALAGITVNLARGSVSSTAGNDAAGIGIDKLKSVENVIAGDFADTLLGSKLANVIDGGAGNDTIDGGMGNDTLTGGAGADRFVFSAKASIKNIDTLTDFETGIDKLVISKKAFGKLKNASDLAEHFAYGSAADTNDYLVYDAGTGALVYDADGSGSKAKLVTVALVGAGLDLSAGDMLLI